MNTTSLIARIRPRPDVIDVTPSATTQPVHRAGQTAPMIRMLFAALMLLTVCVDHAAADEGECGTLRNAYGPFDYRKAGPQQLRLVEDYHFTPKVERLYSGESSSIQDDIAYLLKVFPNHHRGLLSLAKLSLREKKAHLPGSPYSMACWFERAMRFQPEDGDVHVVFGYYLSKTGNMRGAADEFREAIRLGVESGNVHYNLALVLLDLGDKPGAVEHAKKAYEAGFQLQGLKKRLQKMGLWTE